MQASMMFEGFSERARETPCWEEAKVISNYFVVRSFFRVQQTNGGGG